MDTQKLKNNSEYYDDSFIAATEVKISLKGKNEFNIRLDEKYFRDIFMFASSSGENWKGFTRDFHELKGVWDVANNGRCEISDVDEYLSDLMCYKDKLTKYEETPNVFDLIVSFLAYAKEKKGIILVELH